MKKFFLVFPTILLIFGWATSTQAATFIVNRTDDAAEAGLTCINGGGDSNDCSLRKAVIEAALLSEDVTITLPSGTITLTQAGDDSNSDVGDLDIDTAASTATQITITGQGMATTVIDCNSSTTSDRCFDIVDGILLSV